MSPIPEVRILEETSATTPRIDSEEESIGEKAVADPSSLTSVPCLSVDAAASTRAPQPMSSSMSSSRAHAAHPGPSGISDNQVAHNNGMFSNASNLNFDHPIMGEHVEVHQHFRDPNILKEMKSTHVTIEAEFDSSDREYAPRCHPGTRTRFLNELKMRIQSGMRITWLFGPAGVGKSAIMQTLAETLAPSIVCLSFFFSRPNNCDDPKKVFPTLAYRLAITNPVYRRYLEDNLATDPEFLAKNLEEQFRRLFIKPAIANKWVDAIPPCVVFLDGLDEAEGSRAQCRILDLIQFFVKRDQTYAIPILWVIASRPEPHLQASFAQIKKTVPGDFLKLEVPIDSDEAAKEVETYIRAAFLQIRKDFWDMVPARWPPEADLLKIATTSSGLFVFASTSIAYIGEENPVHRLNHIVSLIDHYQAKSCNVRPSLTRNPFELLDILYGTIMDGISYDCLSTTRVILGFYLLDEFITGNPPLTVAREILGYDEYEVYAALRGLHSVIRIPPQDDCEASLKFLHTSFSDFLRDESRSGKHWIDMNEEIRRTWQCYVRVFRKLLRTRRPELISLTFDELGYCIQEDALLRNHIRHNWLGTLVTHCHALPCDCGVSYHLELDTAQLVGAFKEFSSVLFCHELHRRPYIRELSTWLFDTSGDSPGAPHGLLEQVYRKTVTLADLTESDFECIFTELQIGRPAFRNLYYEPFVLLLMFDTTSLRTTRWEDLKNEPPKTADVLATTRLELPGDWKVLEVLMHLGKERQTKYTVRIFGMNEDALWAVISGAFTDSGGNTLNHVMFPYRSTR